MRVALFTDSDYLKINGVTRTLQAVVRYAGEDVHPRIYTASDVDVDEPTYFATRTPGMGLPYYRSLRIHWPPLVAFARELRRHPVDVIHTTTPGPVGLAARWLARAFRLPLVGSYHTEFGKYGAELSGSARAGRRLERLVRWYYRPCSPILVPSAAIREALVSRRYPADRLRVWGRGVDPVRFAPSHVSAARREAWGVSADRPAILYAGRVSREKGLGIVGAIESRLAARGLSHRFIFAGDGPIREELQAQCPAGAFLGPLSHDDVAVAMASADLFFFPSATDTLGNVVLEAQASGLPVVVSDRGGPQEHVAHGRTGFVCQAGDVDAFTDALATLLADATRRRAMGRAARDYALTRDWPHALEPLIDAWTAAARRRPVSAEPVFGAASAAVFREDTSR